MRAYTYQQTPQKINYNRSEQLALKYGFEVIIDANAYNGRYFIKDGKKWIHNIGALKAQLRVSSEDNLITMGYDVVTYKLCH